MDPICHTLVGTALSHTGLERKTRFGRVTLILGANAPDIDVISYCWGEITALEFRRGITHGIPALLILPVLLTGSVLLGAALSGRWSKRAPHQPEIRVKWLLILSTLSVASHPALDFLNVYGVRWLMPFDDSWFYGDTLYIVDPWMWAILAIGILMTRFSRKRDRCVHPPRASSAGLLVALTYIVFMAAGSSVSRKVVESEFSMGDLPRLMIAPVPVDPFRRSVVIDDGASYRFGSVELLPRPRFELDDPPIQKGTNRVFERAAQTSRGRDFLHWARFPYFAIDDRDKSSESIAVYLLDARYTRNRRDSFGVVRIVLPRDGAADPR